ncbi:MAG: 50S ribosomal protein L4 [Acidobacteria bacterium]|nr:MAG: 50S ribosomal protein L4 [Acidobacteriota bacterium]
MAVVDVRNLQGKTVGQVELADAVFGAQVNPHLLHEAVRWFLAGERAGTHKTKGRGEVSGSGRKLWRQKGTGRARVGSIRSSIWRKGGTVHGPQPRSYAYRLPKKMVLGALRSALSAKLSDQKLTVIDGWKLDSHKTKEFRAALTKLDGETRTMLVVEGPGNRNLELASRNLQGVKVVAPAALQAYDILRHDRVLLSQDTALHLGRSLGPEGAAPAAAASHGGGAETAPSAPKSRAPSKRRQSKAASRPKSKLSTKAKSPARAKSKSKAKAKDKTKDKK